MIHVSPSEYVPVRDEVLPVTRLMHDYKALDKGCVDLKY